MEGLASDVIAIPVLSVIDPKYSVIDPKYDIKDLHDQFYEFRKSM